MAQVIPTGHGQEDSIIPVLPHGDGIYITIQKAAGKTGLHAAIIKIVKTYLRYSLQMSPGGDSAEHKFNYLRGFVKR